MKRMTKEELIEYFMQLLGDNELLQQVMTIDQIREKLNKCIIEVTYNPENFGQGRMDYMWRRKLRYCVRKNKPRYR